jgi:hypothetical protein
MFACADECKSREKRRDIQDIQKSLIMMLTSRSLEIKK